jgi:hypothetical protein
MDRRLEKKDLLPTLIYSLQTDRDNFAGGVGWVMIAV